MVTLTSCMQRGEFIPVKCDPAGGHVIAQLAPVQLGDQLAHKCIVLLRRALPASAKDGGVLSGDHGVSKLAPLGLRELRPSSCSVCAIFEKVKLKRVAPGADAAAQILLNRIPLAKYVVATTLIIPFMIGMRSAEPVCHKPRPLGIADIT